MDVQNAQIRIDAFVSKWHQPLFRYCSDNQKQASWYLWMAMYFSLRSLRHLAGARDVTGCFVVARSCLEHDVAIAAIAEDRSLGDKYIDYEAHGKNRFLQRRKTAEVEGDWTGIENYMANRYGPDFAQKNKPSWHDGFRNLCKTAKREGELATHVAYCQVVHGTICGVQLLNYFGTLGKQACVDCSTQLVKIHTLSYLTTTESVLELLFGDLWTPAKKQCTGDLKSLAESIVLSPQK